jgi:ABC-type hemin transport system substrate-binding protein
MGQGGGLVLFMFAAGGPVFAAAGRGAGAEAEVEAVGGFEVAEVEAGVLSVDASMTR